MLSDSHGRVVVISDDTDLLGSGIVDSKTMIDILMFGEEVSGSTLDMDQVDVSIFAKAQHLHDLFFGHDVDAGCSAS
jgi:hypothetical protein